MNSLFSDEISTKRIFYRHSRGASNRSGKEFHTYHEIILFLNGDAVFISEDTHIKILPNTLIIIPKETYHQLIIHADPNNYYRCVLNFEDEPELLPFTKHRISEVRFIRADHSILFYFETLNNLATAKNPCKEIVLKAALILLLNEIADREAAPQLNNSQNPIIHDAISHINQNITKKLSVETVANVCNISRSSLSHIFKKEMNISLHQFIIKKRLIAAYHKIAAGQAPTAVAVECGFHDYSGFYRHYKKMFGHPPSNKQMQQPVVQKNC